MHPGIRPLSALIAALSLSAAVLSRPPPANAAEASIRCTLHFTMSGWSVFYKTASGSGTIHCSNGRTMHVSLTAKGGGLTVGKSVEDGRGEFSSVASPNELIGSYVSAGAHAGAVKSAQVQVMTKGEVSLALSGKGRGWDLGIDFGELKIERR